MRKLLLVIFVAVSCNYLFAQDTLVEFPYGKMLKMTHDELMTAKFRYDNNKNQYVLTKLNGLNTAVSVLDVFAGIPTNYKPNVNDYQVVIQKGENQVSSVLVTFYDSELYHRILTFAADNGENMLETNSVSLNKVQFSYIGYSFDLSYIRKNQSESIAYRGIAAHNDQSYNIYTFLIMTGVEPASEWHTKQAKKAKKRDDKGRKKQSAFDLL